MEVPMVVKLVPILAAMILACGAFSGPLQAQYPSKPVRLVIPFPPGGPTDSAVRVFLPVLSQVFGQEFSVENLAGDHGSRAPVAVMRAAPDGHTLLVGNSSPLVAVPVLRLERHQLL
jgi:tripartite-type tricarboxylate transporter receptor subunit TctC